MTNCNRRITFTLTLLNLALAVGAFAGGATADAAWGSAWKKKIPQSASFYDMAGRGEVFSILDGARQFNRGIKRDDTILVTGDRARFALLRILPDDTVMPDFQKFGDGRVQIIYQGQKHWLDLMKGCKTTFYPGATEYEWDTTTIPGLKANLLVTQAGDWGIVARLSLTNTSAQPMEVQADWIWGGVARITRTMSAEYFPPDRDDSPGDKVALGEASATLQEDQFPYLATVAAYPLKKPVISNSRVVYSYGLNLKPGKSESVYLVASHSDLTNGADQRVVDAQPEKLISESRKYYEAMLAPYAISTPNPVLDSGFFTGIANLDYEYTAPAWLEGVHWWGASFPNISQINAAMLLGQQERARKALEYFGMAKEADYVYHTASGRACGGGSGSYDYDAFPYHLRDVMQYYDFTGDRALLEQFWPRLMSATQKMWKLYAGSDPLLLKFHFGCNCLMYQADDLGLPGVGASPSLIMAGLPERLGNLAVSLGKTNDARLLKERTAAMYEALQAKVWNPEMGYFYNHVDLQGVPHTVHYYSDFVWPTLYTSLDVKYGWQSLSAMNHALWLNPNGTEPPLMRVGDMKPSMFGDDNVMPFQMAEAARAYFRIGDKDRGTKLLESVALAGTVFTEAPGNFPERMLDNGRGDANYIFGPPTGAYMMGLIDGLFGLGLTDGGKAIAWRPGFPETWDSAHLKVPYAELTYQGNTNDNLRTDRYLVKSPTPKGLKFSIFLKPAKVLKVLDNGRPVDYTLTTALDTMLLEFTEPAASSHTVEIQTAPIVFEVKGPTVTGVGLPVAWDMGAKIKSVMDPQHVVSGLKVDGTIVSGEAGKVPGWHQFFVELANWPVIKNVEVEIRPRYELDCSRAVYDLNRRTLQATIRVATPGTIPAGARLRLTFMNKEANVKLDWAGMGEMTRTVEFADVPLLPEGVYAVDCAIMDGAGVVFKNTNNVTLAGFDAVADTAMRKLRDERTRRVDLSKAYNTDTIRLQAHPCVLRNYVVDRTDYAKGGGLVRTVAGDFSIPMTGPYMALVEYGSSDATTREMIKTDKPASITVPIGKKALELALLFACEHESRNTFATLGRLQLKYTDGYQTEIPLVSTKNMDTINGEPFAKETIALEVKIVNQDVMPSSIKVLRIPCDPARVLESLRIEASLADFELGLIGANVITPE
jgi:hypothetical protein